MSGTQHPFFIAFLDHLRASGKSSTATTYSGYLGMFERWFISVNLAPENIATDDLRHYQRWLSETYRRRDGTALATSTRATAILVVKSAYRFLYNAGHVLFNPALHVQPPKTRRAFTVAKEHLSQEEVQALIETTGALVAEETSHSQSWATAQRNRALIAVALATGRRCLGLVSLRLTDLDMERHELRVSIEKAKMGRVLPVAEWAIDAVRHYLDGPRQQLLGADASSPWLWVSPRADQLGSRGFAFVLESVMKETITRNPDLTELPNKRISTHSLRVSFAKLMHDHGCNIRSLNELMLHRSLNTTAAYTPITVDDLRRAVLPCHPRA
jgi:site-specific recombinase XerD